MVLGGGSEGLPTFLDAYACWKGVYASRKALGPEGLEQGLETGESSGWWEVGEEGGAVVNEWLKNLGIGRKGGWEGGRGGGVGWEGCGGNSLVALVQPEPFIFFSEADSL